MIFLNYTMQHPFTGSLSWLKTGFGGPGFLEILLWE
jgi:hypothetical protein